MNRKQRRKIEKDARAMRVDERVTDLYLSMSKDGFEMPSPPKPVSAGDRVMLDVERIKARRNYDKMAESYKDFVSASGGTVFTANVERENLISLVEEPKWLFWSGDLIPVEDFE